MCEFLHTNTRITIPPQGELCTGCHQRGICVCLTPLASDSPRLPPQKKRTLSQKSSINKKDMTTPLPAYTPGKQDTPVNPMKSVICSQDSAASKSWFQEMDVPLDLSLSASAASSLPCSSSSSSSSSSFSSSVQMYPPEAYHLLMRLLDPSPDTRISATEALTHPFLNP